MKTRPIALGLLLASALGLGCDGDASVTEIVLVVDTDIASLDRFDVRARYPSGEIANARADLTAQPAPRTLVFRHRSGSLGPLWFEVSGWVGEAQRIAVQRELAFESGQSLTLRVFLADACASAACDPDEGETCGNSGDCRPTDVRSCEFEGRMCGGVDAGPPTDASVSDAGVDASVDGGPCPLTAICGVSPLALVGDRITPTSCTTVDEPFDIAVLDASGTALSPIDDTATDPAYVLSNVGSYAVRFSVDGVCEIETRTLVSAPEVFADATSASGSGALRDIAGRDDAAFVAAETGAYVVDVDGWRRMQDVTDWQDIPLDLGAVAMRGRDDVLFGPATDLGDTDYVFHADVNSDRTGGFTEWLWIPPGNRAVRDIANEPDLNGDWAVATADGLVFLENEGDWGAWARGPVADLSWTSIGEDNDGDHGESFAGTAGEAYNIAQWDRSLFNSGEGASPPSGVGALRGAAFDDQSDSRENLWFCGATGVALYSFYDHDWPSLTTFPEPDVFWPIECFDIEVDPRRREAWVATGSRGIARLFEDGVSAEIVPGAGFPAGRTGDRIFVWRDGRRIRVWVLDLFARSAIRYQFDE